MIRLLNLGLGLIALWLAVLLIAGELGGWTYLLLFGGVAAALAALAIAARRRFTLRSGNGRAEYE